MKTWRRDFFQCNSYQNIMKNAEATSSDLKNTHKFQTILDTSDYSLYLN